MIKDNRMVKYLFGNRPKLEDFSRKLEPWESDPHCLRSIKFHYKKKVQRAKDYSNTVHPPKPKGFGSRLRQAKGQNAPIFSHDQQEKKEDKTKTTGVLSLIDEKALKTKKARMNKEIELQKHITTVNHLKRKLAKQIVSKTSNVEDFKQLSLEDLFKHAQEIEDDKARARDRKIAMHATKNEKERALMLEKLWDQKVDKNIQSQVARYSSNFDLGANLTEEQLEV